MKVTITWAAANGERIHPDLLPKKGQTVPLLTEDGYQQDAQVVHAESTTRRAKLELKVPQAIDSLPGLTP